MLAYEGPLNWPVMPRALVLMCLQRYFDWHLEYGPRWGALFDAGLGPADPGLEVYEASQTTVYTFFEGTEGVENPSDFSDLYADPAVDGLRLDWLQFQAGYFSSSLVDWIADHPNDWPPPQLAFPTSQEQVLTTWVVWHMWLLLLTEEFLSLTSKNWRSTLNVEV